MESSSVSDPGIVVIGKNGSENSRVGNTILGTRAFQSEDPLHSQHHSLRIGGDVEGRRVTVINTSNLLQPNLEQHQLTQTVRECVSKCAPGPHVIIVVLQFNDFNDADRHRVKHVLNLFSKQAINHTIVLTTDEEIHTPIFTSKNETVRSLIKECGGHLKFDESPGWRSELFRRIEEILKDKQDEFLICDLYEDGGDGSSVDGDPIRSGALIKGDTDDGKLKESTNSDGGVTSGKAKLNVVLCGNNTTLKKIVSKMIRGTLNKPMSKHEKESKECVKKEGKIDGRQISVIELPALTRLSEQEVMRQIHHCLSLCDPGVHLFILVAPVTPLTNEDEVEMQKINRIFCSKDHFMVLFITDRTVDQSMSEFVSSTESERIGSLYGSCYTVMELKDHKNSETVLKILNVIDQLKTKPYSLQMFLSAPERRIRHHLEQKLSVKENQIKELQQKIKTNEKVKLNLVVCGSNRGLKSFISNLILNQNESQSELSSECVTEVELNGRLIRLLELPDLIGLSEEEVMRQTLRCVSLCHPGVHLFLLIIPDDPLNNEEKAEIEEIQKIFSSRVNKHMMILIKQSSGDKKRLDGETQAVIQRFGGRQHFIEQNTQVSTLMEDIEQKVEENRGEVYSIETFLESQMEKLMKYEEMKRRIKSLETWFQSQDSRDREDELRIVLLGKTGVGKSSTGNTILGREAFLSDISQTSVTKVCQKQSTEINGRNITVIDSPGLFDTKLTIEEIKREISHCISMILPGPHVFLLLITLGRFTQEEQDTVKIIQENFGENSLTYTIVLFTRGDDLKDKTIDHFLGKSDSVLKNLIETCGNRVHVFNNNQTGDRTQVSELLEKIDNMVKTNGGSYYSCKMFREMERGIQEQKEKIMLEKVEKLKTEKEELVKKHKEEKERMMEEERQKHDEEKKRREEEFNEREERYKRDIKEREEEKRKIREESERDRQQERERREEEEERRRKREQEMRDEYNQRLKEEKEIQTKMIEEERQNHEKERKRRDDEFREREGQYKTEMKRERDRRDQEEERRRKIEKETWDEYYQRLKREIDRRQREKDDLQLKHEKEKKIMKKMKEQKLNYDKERKRRENEVRERENLFKRDIQEIEEQERKIREEMKREREEWEKQRQQDREREEEEHEKLKSIQLYEKTPLVQHTNNDEDSPSDPECLRIILFGRTGVGKSATGNTILGRNEFLSEASIDSVTTTCQKGVGEVNGQSVAVVDTPDLFDTTNETAESMTTKLKEITEKKVLEEIVKCVSLSAPGPHVFIIVLSVGRITQEEKDILDMIKMIFGPIATDFSIILFTREDKLTGQTIQQYVEVNDNDELKKLISDCGNRFLTFNNNETEDRTQVTELLNMIEEVKKKNEGRYFSNEMFEEAAISAEERMKILEENERKHQNQAEELKDIYEREIRNMRIRLKEKKQKKEEERVKLEMKLKEREETLRREFEEKEKSEQKKREEEDQKRSELEKQLRGKDEEKPEEMKREIEDLRSEHKKRQQEREEEERKREEKYKEDQEKMEKDHEHIIAKLRKEQEDGKKKRDSDKQERKEKEEKERKEWRRKIEESENDRKEMIEEQQREWEEEKKREMREREEEERKREEKYKKQLREKQEELEKTRERFEQEKEEERQKMEEQREKLNKECEQKDKEYVKMINEIKTNYEQVEEEREEEWKRREREDEERREEKRKRWRKILEDLKQEREEEIRRREREERERIEKEEKEFEEMKQKNEEEIKAMKMKHQNEFRKQEQELNDFKKRKEQHVLELKERFGEFQKQLNEVNRLRQEVKKTSQEENRLQEENNRLQEEKNTAQDKNNKLQEEKNRLQEEKERAQEENNRLQEEINRRRCHVM